MIPSALIAAFLLLAGSASAVTILSDAAGFVGTTSSSCYGSVNNVEIEIIYNAYQCQRQGVVEFRAPASLTRVESAVVTLFDGAAGNSFAPTWAIDIFGYAGDLQITEADLGAGDYLTTATWFRYAPDGAPLQVDVTEFVNSQLSLGSVAIGLNLRANGEYYCQGCPLEFIYFDGAGLDRPPTLTLETVPEPAGLWLVAIALSVPVGRRLGGVTGC